MTSTATSRHVGGRHGEHESGRGHDLVIFASVVLAVLNANAHNVLASLRTWGWGIVIRKVAAAGSVLKRNPLARWFGVAAVALYALCTYDSRPNLGATRPT